MISPEQNAGLNDKIPTVLTFGTDSARRITKASSQNSQSSKYYFKSLHCIPMHSYKIFHLAPRKLCNKTYAFDSTGNANHTKTLAMTIITLLFESAVLESNDPNPSCS